MPIRGYIHLHVSWFYMQDKYTDDFLVTVVIDSGSHVILELDLVVMIILQGCLWFCNWNYKSQRTMCWIRGQT